MENNCRKRGVITIPLILLFSIIVIATALAFSYALTQLHNMARIQTQTDLPLLLHKAVVTALYSPYSSVYIRVYLPEDHRVSFGGNTITIYMPGTGVSKQYLEEQLKKLTPSQVSFTLTVTENTITISYYLEGKPVSFNEIELTENTIYDLTITSNKQNTITVSARA
ncbi:MAG: hypothetical protein DRJ52_04410 [Thermoprotei archaeon]|nr:MAG: hypothetical protein DRJ52_04410 [Thermoprotei archaeon]